MGIWRLDAGANKQDFDATCQKRTRAQEQKEGHPWIPQTKGQGTFWCFFEYEQADIQAVTLKVVRNASRIRRPSH